MRIIKTHQLSYEVVFPYFSEHIRCGNTLSKRVLERIDFRLGMFFTILPEEIYQERLFWFDCPIIPANEQNNVITTDREYSDFIYKFLQKARKNCAIVEDAIRRVCDPRIEIENVKLLLFENEIYYLLKKNTEEEVFSTMRNCKEFWHSLIVLTSLESADKLNKLDNDVLNTICDNANCVLTGAYDNDSYIFWQKR